MSIEPANVGDDYVEAYVPVTLLTDLAGQAEVIRIDAIIPPVADTVVSQGAEVHNAPLWNGRGYSGSGVKVGVIDGGFEGFTELMGTELPGAVVARCYSAVGAFSGNLANCEQDSIHGTAVAETIIDIARDAELYIANPTSKGDLRATTDWMVANGVQVINMSLAWTWDGPGDGTSPYSDSPLNTVNKAVAGGAVWVNAAKTILFKNASRRLTVERIGGSIAMSAVTGVTVILVRLQALEVRNDD